MPDFSITPNISRINIIGTSGSGKSTFSKALAGALNYPYVEMDQLYWQPGWQGTPDETFFPKLEAALQTDYWVLDGNYTRTASIKWKQVQMVIWLDYPFYIVFMRMIKRVLRRAITREEIWPGTGNRESLMMALGKDSIIRWMLKTYKTNKDQYEAAMSDPGLKDSVFIRLENPKQAEQFLKKIKCRGGFTHQITP